MINIIEKIIVFHITNNINIKRQSHQEKKRKIRNKVLELFFKSSSSPMPKKKKLGKKNNSVSKIPKKLASSSSKVKLSELKSKNHTGYIARLRKNHCSMNLPFFSSRSICISANNNQYKTNN